MEQTPHHYGGEPYHHLDQLSHNLRPLLVEEWRIACLIHNPSPVKVDQ